MEVIHINKCPFSIYWLQSYSHPRSHRGTHGFIFRGRECSVFWRYSFRRDNCSGYKWPKINVPNKYIPKLKQGGITFSHIYLCLTLGQTGTGVLSNPWLLCLSHHFFVILYITCQILFWYPLQRSCRGVYWFHHVRPSVRPSVCRQILCRTITWVVFLRIF